MAASHPSPRPAPVTAPVLAAALALALACAAPALGGPWGTCPIPPGDVAPGAIVRDTEPSTWRVTGDGRVDVADVVVTLRCAVGLQDPRAVSAACASLPGDLAPGTVDAATVPPTWHVVGDGAVDVTDVVALLRATVGLHQIAPLPDRGDASLATFASCAELEAWVEASARAAFEQYGYWSWGWWGGPWGGGRGDADGVLVPTAGGAGAPAYSETNTQFGDVDEADVVETDGATVYAISGSKVHVVRAWPAESLALLATIPIDGSPHGLYLQGANLAVVSIEWGAQPAGGFAADVDILPWQGAVKVASWDVSAPSSPRLVRETWFEGSLVASRMIGERLHLTLFESLQGPELPPWDGDDAAWRAEALRRIDAATVEDWLPHVTHRERTAAGWTVTRELAVPCEAVEHPQSPAGAGFVHLLTHEPFTDGSSDGLAIAGTAQVVSTSATTTYVAAYPEGGAGGMRIHQLRLSAEKSRPLYLGSGQVPGFIPSQFAMDAWKGVLRVASQTNDPTTGAPSTSIFTLRTNSAGDLERLGAIEQIAPTEWMRSVRFAGDEGYLVTFRQVDPLFTLDLSDPRAPRIAGEATITGFSSYLHPLANGRLLGIGVEIDPVTQRGVGSQVSLFDVSDFARPTLVDREVAPEATSEAQWDHHAFTFFEPSHALAVPLSTTGPDGNPRAGVRVFDVRPDGLTVLGTVDTSALAPAWGWWCGQARRAIFLDDVVLAVGESGIVAARMGHLEQAVASLPFETACGGGAFP